VMMLTPALSAVRGRLGEGMDRKVSLSMLGSIGSFTPVLRDEELARAYFTAGKGSRSRAFRFTPTNGTTNSVRSLTVVVRARSLAKEAQPRDGERSQGSLGLAPVSYSLGRDKGLQRFAVVEAKARDLSRSIGAIEGKVASGYTLKPRKAGKLDRFSADLHVASQDAVTATPDSSEAPTLADEKSYSLDLSSSYSLTRNLKLKAGVRYSGPSNRLVPIEDQAQDSQAVYVGTTFKF
jgi:hypothetical protein